MVPAEKISTIPMMTEANQPQFSRPIMHMKPVPMTARVAHGLDRRQVLRESGRCESRQGCGDGQEAAEAMSEHAKFPCFTEDR
jgi:hypothetical protein